MGQEVAVFHLLALLVLRLRQELVQVICGHLDKEAASAFLVLLQAVVVDGDVLDGGMRHVDRDFGDVALIIGLRGAADLRGIKPDCGVAIHGGNIGLVRERDVDPEKLVRVGQVQDLGEVVVIGGELRHGHDALSDARGAYDLAVFVKSLV